MKKTRWLGLLLALLTVFASAQAEGEDKILRAALSLLPQDHALIVQYNKTHPDAPIAARFALGVPYFYGGRDEAQLLLPRAAWQDSQYFRKGQWYLYGFDCSGFCAWALAQGGRPDMPPIGDLMLKQVTHGSHRIKHTDGLPEELPRVLKVGDLLLVRKGLGYHAMLYIGTLSDFGFDAASLDPALAPYLNHPLLIHSADNPFYVDSYARYIAGLNKPWLLPPDGGITVSLFGPEPFMTPHSKPYALHPGDFRYFLLGDSPVSVYPLPADAQTLWVRW